MYRLTHLLLCIGLGLLCIPACTSKATSHEDPDANLFSSLLHFEAGQRVHSKPPQASEEGSVSLGAVDRPETLHLGQHFFLRAFAERRANRVEQAFVAITGADEHFGIDVEPDDTFAEAGSFVLHAAFETSDSDAGKDSGNSALERLAGKAFQFSIGFADSAGAVANYRRFTLEVEKSERHCPAEAQCEDRVCGFDPECATSCGRCGTDMLCTREGSCAAEEDRCNAGSCGKGERCNPETGGCDRVEKDCVLDGCAAGFTCHAPSGECVVDAGAEQACAVGEVENEQGVCVATGCQERGCGDAGQCDLDSGVCVDPEVPACSVSGCAEGEYCDVGSERCEPETCIQLGCPRDELCNAQSGQCEPDTCLRVKCSAGWVCDAKSGACIREVDPLSCTAFGCAKGSTCNADTDRCEPAPCEPLDLSACGDLQNCVQLGEEFRCADISAPFSSGGECRTASECDVGLACVSNEVYPSCLGAQCCASYCPLNAAASGCAGAANCQPASFGAEAQVGVCIPDEPVNCHPFESASGCELAETCHWTAAELMFSCGEPGLVESGGPCTTSSDCIADLSCLSAADIPGCGAERCCGPICDVRVAGHCGDGARCETPGEWLVSNPDVGVCRPD